MYPGDTVLISRKQTNKPKINRIQALRDYLLISDMTVTEKRNDPEMKIYSCGILLTLRGIRVIQLLNQLEQSTDSTESTGSRRFNKHLVFCLTLVHE